MWNRGKEHFKIILIETCSADILNERERYWIECYHSYVKDPDCQGYNLTPGGDGNSLTDAQIKQIRTLWEEGKSHKEISEITGLSYSTVSHRICKYPDYDAKKNLIIRGKKNEQRPVDVYSLTGEKIATYISLAECGRQLKVHPKNLSEAIRCNYRVKNYYITDKDVPLKIKKHKTVLQFDLQGNLINKFEDMTLKNISKITNCADDSISRTCSEKQQSCKGYLFMYEQDYTIENLQRRLKLIEQKQKYYKKEFRAK